MSETRVALVTNAREYAGPGSVDALLGEAFTVVCHDRAFDDEAARQQFADEHPGALPLAEQEPATLAEHGELAERIKKDVPIQRLGQQHEMGALVAFLASQKAMPVTGQTMAFAGGFYP